MSMSQGQRQSPSKPNPLSPSASSSQSPSYQLPTVGPGSAQYVNVNVRPGVNVSGGGGGGVTSPPTTPFLSEDARLLANNASGSAPSSPMDFSVTPIPPPRKSSRGLSSAVSPPPPAPVSSSSSSPSTSPPSSVFAPSPLNRSHMHMSPSSTQTTFSSIPNPFSSASRGGSSVGIIPNANANNNNNNINNNNTFTPPSRPASRGSITPFPAYNVSNPPLSQGHPNAAYHGPHSHSSPNANANSNNGTPSRSGSAIVSSPSSPLAAAADEGVLATLGLGANNSGFPTSMGARGAGSMVLYRLADDPRASSLGTGGTGGGTGGGRMSAASRSASASASASSREPLLVPPRGASGGLGGGGGGGGGRSSLGSSAGDADTSSVLSFSDSKYPFNHSYGGGAGGTGTGASSPSSRSPSGSGFSNNGSGNGNGNGSGSVRGLIPYVYDPSLDENEPLDEEDLLHDPNPRAWMSGKYDRLASSANVRAIPVSSASSSAGVGSKGKGKGVGKAGTGPGGTALTLTPLAGEKRLKTIWEKNHFPWRGIMNVGVLLALVLALLGLFAVYPIFTFYRDRARNARIEGNVRINATGQAAVLFQMPDPIDAETPESARTRTGFDGLPYELVFSDEFNTPGRTFWPGDDPFWEAVNLWYGATQDLEWYDPSQITTRDGALIITMDSTSTTQAHLTPGSTAPFTEADNHQMTYRSGMLQSWNKFCFTTGYIEVAVTFPGPDQSTQGYWPGAWTMGNLARPGYPATTDGLWPYTYDTCDVGTFPNQTYKDRSGPAAALTSTKSRPAYNYELSWLPGQRLSSCSCPGSDHPGPTVNRGRGAPEIDIFEAEKDKDIPIVGIVSQSGQFAPFSHDYLYSNDSGGWTNFDETRTRANTYRGSAVQQSVSGLTRVPADMFQGQPGGGVFRTFGFEYWSDIGDREGGSITWQVDGQKSHRVVASAVGPDKGEGGSMVGQRLIPEEPMSIVLNLGISANWQKIDLTTMQFPAEMKVDYVRVYQRKGHTNTGCDPKNYPTADYINSHLEAYTDVNMTAWPWEKPKNSQYDGC